MRTIGESICSRLLAAAQIKLTGLGFKTAWLICVLAGSVLVGSFAPFGYWPLSLISLVAFCAVSTGFKGHRLAAPSLRLCPGALWRWGCLDLRQYPHLWRRLELTGGRSNRVVYLIVVFNLHTARLCLVLLARSGWLAECALDGDDLGSG